MAQTHQRALDHSHHLSLLSRSRTGSPLKGLAKYWGQPNIISLAGGFPHHQYFPFATVGGQVYPADSFPLSALSSDPQTVNRFNQGVDDSGLQELSIPKLGTSINLASALQYSLAQGIQPLRQFVHDFTERIFQPSYSDWTTFLHAGNTDALATLVDTLFDPGQGYFTEEFSYPSAQATAVPHGVKPVAVAMDAQGLRADDLRRQCVGWDSSLHGGMSRPHVLYTVPIGQNPCGTCMGVQRKKDIYDVCVEFDIIIIEDDPYYFLQQEHYVPSDARHTVSTSLEDDSDEQFLSKLEPSFLSFDVQGRVIRLDSFSKTVAPGSRLGWFTCAPLFAERIERQTEVSTQNPCGFGQALIGQLMAEQWKINGYIRWLRGLRAQYTARRDYAVDCITEAFDIVGREEAGTRVFICSAGGKSLFEFVPPRGGMFLWMALHLQNHPQASGPPSEELADRLERDIWTHLAENGLLVTPGWYFNAAELKGKGHFRISFSFSEADELRRAIQIFASVIKEVFNAV
ncbi:PLP-dependent transferase [Auriculariales sp. MPI-PUGE-AT-0066]|nr:PLP-dependent transferase [Auriculariales sp. MPI-PUGE-AT-0066]